MRTYNTLLPIASVCMLTHCAKLPNAKATEAGKELRVPGQFDASLTATPEVVKGLKSLFSDSQLNNYVSKA